MVFRKLLALLILMLFAIPAAGQDLAIKGDGVRPIKVDKVITVKEDATLITSFPFVVQAPTGAAIYSWVYPAAVVADDQGDSLLVMFAPKGRLTIGVKMLTVDFDAKKIISKYLKTTCIVGDVPVPPGPGPGPGPGPDPKPPDPPMPVKLIGIDGFAVLMVFDVDASGVKATTGQDSFMRSAITRQYLDSKCANDPSRADWKAHREWKSTADVSAESKVWKDAFGRKRTATPWIVISSPKGSYEGELPKTFEECIALLKKYGGE